MTTPHPTAWNLTFGCYAYHRESHGTLYISWTLPKERESQIDVPFREPAASVWAITLHGQSRCLCMEPGVLSFLHSCLCVFLDFSFCFIAVCLTHTKTPQKPNCKIFLIHYKIIALEINRLLYDSSSQYLWYGCCPHITVRSSPWKSNETAGAHSTPGLWFQSGPKYKILKSLIMPCSEAWSSSTEDSPWPQSQMQTPVGCGHTGTRGKCFSSLLGPLCPIYSVLHTDSGTATHSHDVSRSAHTRSSPQMPSNSPCNPGHSQNLWKSPLWPPSACESWAENNPGLFSQWQEIPKRLSKAQVWERLLQTQDKEWKENTGVIHREDMEDSQLKARSDTVGSSSSHSTLRSLRT